MDDGIEIVGYSGKSEFSYLYTNYSNRTFYLLSQGHREEAVSFFYDILGDFAPVFDLIFLKNCIKITELFSNEEIDEPSKGDYFKMYQLHKAQFSRLMIRAHVMLQPDIHDNKFPDFEPAQEIGGV